MYVLLMTVPIFFLFAACSRPPYHFHDQYSGRPPRIACSSCHTDIRRHFDHQRGWSDDHRRYRQHNKHCISCHPDTACKNCHHDASGKLIWSEIRQDRWNRKKE